VTAWAGFRHWPCPRPGRPSRVPKKRGACAHRLHASRSLCNGSGAPRRACSWRPGSLCGRFRTSPALPVLSDGRQGRHGKCQPDQLGQPHPDGTNRIVQGAGRRVADVPPRRSGAHPVTRGRTKATREHGQDQREQPGRHHPDRTNQPVARPSLFPSPLTQVCSAGSRYRQVHSREPSPRGPVREQRDGPRGRHLGGHLPWRGGARQSSQAHL
jgi:hypothetical protein